NRFVPVGVKRTRYLSWGADYTEISKQFAVPLKDAIARAATLPMPMQIANDARDYWAVEYQRLEQERPGNYGAATSRLSVHAQKIALIYAALDGTTAIGLRHLQPALALVAHADETAQRLFDTPQAVAEEPSHVKLLAFIRSRPDGINRTDAY